MKCVLEFGKVDGYNIGRENCLVTADIELTDDGCFSATANLWKPSNTDIIMGGQCIDFLYQEYEKLRNNPEFCELKDLWEKYHLNNFHAGTKAQEDALKEAVNKGILKTYGANNYKESCDYLASIDLLYDKNYLSNKQVINGNIEMKPYKYGSGWIKEDIPENDLKRIKSLIETGKKLSNDLELNNETDLEL